MELNSASIHDVIHPTAAFSQQSRVAERDETAYSLGGTWDKSLLNPKNRIDSLDPPQDPLWRIDGCTGLGTQYYAVPLFLADAPPMRFDVFIPEAAASPRLREQLDLDAAFHTKDAARLRPLGISRHILRTLQAWITENGHDMYQKMCETLPFGSRIIFENLHADIRMIRISVVPTYDVERQLLGLAKLGSSLGVDPGVLPEAIDISRLSIVRQLHDSVCIVRMRGSKEDDEAARLWILKALTSDTKYLFLELRNLLQTEPHANIISRPEYLVTKRCRFGNKTAVVGFILPFHAPGSMRDTLPLLRVHGRLGLTMQLKWASELASAISHLRESCHTFYPDLRLDNILLSGSNDVVMVDFEQRGVWCEFAAPEVNAIEYMRILASDDSEEGGHGQNADDVRNYFAEILDADDIRNHFADILDRLVPDWDDLQACEEYSSPRPHGYPNYNIAWLGLDETEREAAMVYMLGRVLWCIFEGQSAPQKGAVWQSYRNEPDIEFPEFRLTPPEVRDIIDRCTRGRRDPLSSLIVRQGNKLVLRGRESSSREEVLRVAKEWWQAEVKVAEQFLRERLERKERHEWDGNHFGRPKLFPVYRELVRYYSIERLKHRTDLAADLERVELIPEQLTGTTRGVGA